MAGQPALDPQNFHREDETPDSLFYAVPRLVTHIDDRAIGAVTATYRELLPPGGAVLDLMSSWVSHLPDDVAYQEVVGLGMNEVELRENPRLDRFVVHDLNADPRLPFESDSFDGAVVTVSVQYLTRPVEVFQEVNRLLRPSAPFILTYSNRCFPTKAIAAWRMTDDRQHASIIATYFEMSGGWTKARASDRTPSSRSYTDPLYAVWAWKLPGPDDV